ncbi:MAG TPA: glycosyltransferase family 4 protein [Anaerolineaceae bacterium]|nr:glycosyltransferase family 4 protein [Anaerolineaceae bacterium]
MPDQTTILIGHFLPSALSGAERSIADLVAALGDRSAPGGGRFRFIMLVPGEGRLADFYRDCGCEVWVENISTPRRLYPGLHTAQSWLLARKLKAAGVDAVIANTFAAASRLRTAARLAGLPLGVFVREIIADRPLHREILAQADLVMVISKDLQAYVSTLTDPTRVVLTYNYINPRPIVARGEAHRRSGRRRLPFDRRHPVVGMIGRITRWKQQDLLLRAAPLILAEVPETRFVIVGDAEDRSLDYQAELHALVDSLGLGDVVAFMGNRKDAIEITTELAVSCLASTREPLGRVILEAHLLGTPVVVSDRGGPAEIVTAGETGLMFDPTAPDAVEQLAAQVVRLLRDPELRRCLTENAQQTINETFAGRRHIEIQQAFFERLAGQKEQADVLS